jgi:Cell division protein FtsI/penicillin-binding protein 2
MAKAAAQDDDPCRRADPSRRHLRSDRDDPAGNDRRPRSARRGSRPAGAGLGPSHPDRRPAHQDPRNSVDPAEVTSLREKLDSGKPYVVLARGIEPSVAERIRQAMRDQRIFNIALEPEPERVYPQAGGGPDSTLAAHLLGFVNRDNVGQYGVEQQYQQTLAGIPRTMVAQRDVNGRPMAETSVVEAPGTIGEDIRLTIDASLSARHRAGAPRRVDR